MQSCPMELQCATRAVAPVDAAAIQAALRRCGLSHFRGGQLDAITATLEGRDSLLILPTGGGKSLTYQVSSGGWKHRERAASRIN